MDVMGSVPEHVAVAQRENIETAMDCYRLRNAVRSTDIEMAEEYAGLADAFFRDAVAVGQEWEVSC